ncbi:synaptophysin/synaptoporin family protein [Loa loa]|uniref:Synaptophysin/synaptoporin family protein n=2 Tax=Loa loa TaxID=7209 RepID=A0A1S0U6W6_LOALO|nr:synaptophysin/synaptoporin family protein [Loa loa]EFO25899.1 synaptophysin/synaptoporin family protein [Loa loa]
MNDQRHITGTITDVCDYQQPQAYYHVEIMKPELDLNYLKTLSGMLKCICITLDFICFICLLVGGPAYYIGVGWIIFVCVFGMLVSLVLLILYLFHIVDLLHQIPWIVSEMIFYFAWAVFFFICGCVLALVAARFHGITGYGAASFLSFGALCAYGFDSYVKFLAWRHNEVATGGIAVKYLPYGDTAVPKDQERKVVINE